MPRFFRTAVVALLISLVTPACGGGSGDGGAGTEPTLLLTTEAQWAGGRAAIVTSFGLGLTHLDGMGDSFYKLYSDGAPWTAGDVGTTRTIRAGETPAFPLFADQVANGIDEALSFRWFANGAEVGGSTTSESVRWGGGFDGSLVPDADGYVITRIECELTQATLDVPGADTNMDGIYTSYDVRWTIRVYGYRAP